MREKDGGRGYGRTEEEDQRTRIKEIRWMEGGRGGGGVDAGDERAKGEERGGKKDN